MDIRFTTAPGEPTIFFVVLTGGRNPTITDTRSLPPGEIEAWMMEHGISVITGRDFTQCGRPSTEDQRFMVRMMWT